MIFTICIEASYRSVCEVFEEFYLLYGLRLSSEKLEFFAAGISIKQAKRLAMVSGFTEGSHPIRYRGLPFILLG